LYRIENKRPGLFSQRVTENRLATAASTRDGIAKRGLPDARPVLPRLIQRAVDAATSPEPKPN
jgi:hypothetical protein